MDGNADQLKEASSRDANSEMDEKDPESIFNAPDNPAVISFISQSGRGGEKTDTFGLGEASLGMVANMTWARNLNKSQLGGVIFVCTNGTMEECLSSQLFGLPAQHFLYVKNIEPGLPLFLFNYSERKLHGIYEAASSGKMHIDSHAWTKGGSDRTQYPAQVRIRDCLICQPLPEHQFKPIISQNYYSPSHFQFELDLAQAFNLISEHSSLAVGPWNLTPKAPQKRTAVTKGSPSEDKRVSEPPSLEERALDHDENTVETRNIKFGNIEFDWAGYFFEEAPERYYHNDRIGFLADDCTMRLRIDTDFRKTKLFGVNLQHPNYLGIRFINKSAKLGLKPHIVHYDFDFTFREFISARFSDSDFAPFELPKKEPKSKPALHYSKVPRDFRLIISTLFRFVKYIHTRGLCLNGFTEKNIVFCGKESIDGRKKVLAEDEIKFWLIDFYRRSPEGMIADIRSIGEIIDVVYGKKGKPFEIQELQNRIAKYNADPDNWCDYEVFLIDHLSIMLPRPRIEFFKSMHSRICFMPRKDQQTFKMTLKNLEGTKEWKQKFKDPALGPLKDCFEYEDALAQSNKDTNPDPDAYPHASSSLPPYGQSKKGSKKTRFACIHGSSSLSPCTPSKKASKINPYSGEGDSSSPQLRNASAVRCCRNIAIHLPDTINNAYREWDEERNRAKDREKYPEAPACITDEDIDYSLMHVFRDLALQFQVHMLPKDFLRYFLGGS